MDSYTVIGYQHSSGEYNGVVYDNYNLSCTRAASEDKDECGEIAVILKVKSSVFNDNVICVGDVITPLYNRFGQIVSLK